MSEYPCAFIDGRAGGKHIVDEADACTGYGGLHAGSDVQRVLQVRQPGGTVQ